MFTVNIKVKNKDPRAFEKLKKRLDEISSKKVVAGFPKGKLNSPYYPNGASIIDVAIWNEFGTSSIPRRDFMGVASQKWQEFFAAKAEEYKNDIINGKIDIDSFLNAMGQAGAEFVSDAIVKLRNPANAPITVQGGWMKNKISGKPFKIKGKGSDNPLFDTGALSRAPIHEIRKKAK